MFTSGMRVLCLLEEIKRPEVTGGEASEDLRDNSRHVTAFQCKSESPSPVLSLPGMSK